MVFPISLDNPQWRTVTTCMLEMNLLQAIFSEVPAIYNLTLTWPARATNIKPIDRDFSLLIAQVKKRVWSHET